MRERLSCKEIWVVGAFRYGNPDHDLPTDFEQHRHEMSCCERSSRTNHQQREGCRCCNSDTQAIDIHRYGDHISLSQLLKFCSVRLTQNVSPLPPKIY
ncbi:hypothetical protein NIES2119_25800 [[Phormidium ambiguum] IAM M-71]|uniref:Uncharacterized protein n=1 Tax=[Phormidium ambiguum] IAM M-71 TaxID=454136 RepID=A0A1U7I800_9CYAN|nr:hypothetical protein NIES2119_25800 [Phormidium ambiguum IAM M-71]